MPDHEPTDPMAFGRFARPTRHGDEVWRTPVDDNREVHRLLGHFGSVGCRLAPRFLGLTSDGRERLTWIPGVTAYPPFSEVCRSDEALVSAARAVRSLHDASQGFDWDAKVFSHAASTVVPTHVDCIGHHDLGPWNLVFDGARVVGVIDWDAAGPSSRIWDLALLAHHLVPLHADSGLDFWGWTEPPDRRRRLALMLDGYRAEFSVEELLDTVVVRLAAFGADIRRRGAKGEPVYRDLWIEGHHDGYLDAAADVVGRRHDVV